MKCQRDNNHTGMKMAIQDLPWAMIYFLAFIGGQPVKCKNYQEIKVQEQVQKLAVGTIPRSMWVILEEDLVDSCKAVMMLQYGEYFRVIFYCYLAAFNIRPS